MGGSLAERIVSGMRATAVRRMLLDILGGLELAHQRGIIHRDVKPANIFFDARGASKLGDFGVAHLLDLGQTQTGGLIGTLAYMAPEQITGARLTIAADLYAVGITLFEALTGRLPFLGPDFVAEHLGVTPPAPSTVVSGLADDWDPIVARLLSKSPTDRYDSVDTLRKDIEAVDLGEDARPKPLLLPRATARPRRASQSEIDPVEPEDEGTEVKERYQFETSIGETEISTLSRALDSSLDRSVIIERYDPAKLDEATERRLFALARGGGPYVQRALSFDRNEKVAVFEAPTGHPITDHVDSQPHPPRIASLAKRLALAVAPMHLAGTAHGALTPTAIVLDEHLNPTVLASGLGPARADATPADDVQALLGILAELAHCDATPTALLSALAPTLSHPEKAAMLAQGNPATGEELYVFAAAVEIALLKAQRRDA
jgi:serine/threonine-protein kinase